MFKKGTSKACRISIPFGGQTEPISGTGAKLAQKKAEDEAKKKREALLTPEELAQLQEERKAAVEHDAMKSRVLTGSAMNTYKVRAKTIMRGGVSRRGRRRRRGGR